MKICFFEVTEYEKNRFKQKFTDDDVYFFCESIQDVNISNFTDVEAISVFVHSKLSGDILKKLPNLKIIATRSTGIDHVDAQYCANNNIAIKNVPLYGENTVAEHTFALILSLSRKIHKSYVRSIHGNFSSVGIQGFDLQNKTIGIIGGGRIGLHVARMAKSFGMHVRVYDIKQDAFLAELINFKYVTLEELLRQSDIISLHVPLNKYTEHMINDESLKMVKPGAILINTARGGLVDTDSLLDALDKGILSGAGLDVIEGEEYLMEENLAYSPIEKANKIISSSKRLLENENVVMTPHNAFNSIEAVNRIIDTTINNLTNNEKVNSEK